MEFNIDPYHDDFETNAKDNNYMKILFKPGYSVQARELTQIQSILQNQIKSFGDHIFQDGSPVIGGNLTLDNKISYVKLLETYNSEDVELDLFLNKIIIKDSDGSVQAKVLATYYPSGGTPTLMVKFISGSEFADSDVLRIAGTTTRAQCAGSNSVGKGTVVSINDGIFYVNGYFVQVGLQTAVVSAYGQNANVKIGLEISDDVVDYVVDSTLLDPAQSSFNYQAPGADRYQFNLNLSTRPLETAVDESSFFELMRVENGAITKQVKYPVYSEIEKTLARRTFDESGDYTISPFVATIDQSRTDDGKYIINLSPGKAYVKGFEFETLGTFKMEASKPRTVGIDTRNLVDIDVDTSYGNYLMFKNVYGSANNNSFIDILNTEEVDLHCVTSNSVAIGLSGGTTANSFFYGNTKIGTAKVRNIQREADSGESTLDSNGIYRVYFTDISIKPKLLKLPENGTNSSTINLGVYASAITNAYQNVSVTVLPIALTPVTSVTQANVFQYSTRVNASGAYFGTVNPGDIIRVGDEVRKVVSINTSSDYLTVNSAFTKTIDGTDAVRNPAGLQVFVQTDYTSNVTGQTRTIYSYDGTTRRATLDRAFDDNSIASSGSVVQLNFSIKDLECVMEANSATPVINAHANVAIQSKLIDGSVEMFEPSKTPLIFRLPRDYVKRSSINNVDYTHTKYIQAAVTGGVAVINPGSYMDATETLPWAITTSAIKDNLIAVVRNGSGNHLTYPNGSILQLSTSQVSSCSGGIKITTSSSISALDVYINVKENNTEVSTLRQKTLRRNTTYTTAPFNYPSPTGVTADYTVTINSSQVAKINVANGLIFITNPNYTNIEPGDVINLYVPDVIKIRRVLMGNTTAPADAINYTDVTDYFDTDLGNTDEMYDHAKLILKQGYSAPAAQLTVHADFYTHTYPSGASYFSCDSYPSSVYSAGEIPVYVSKTGTYFLRDCLDFRPSRQIGTYDPSTASISFPRITSPDTTTELSYDYYLPRVDKLVLSKNKEFRIIQGTSSPSPIPPEDSDDAMTLYNIYLPPYVANVKDIRMKYIENKRYTMKDISSIDKRVKSIEYYTALNNIESMALSDPTQYEDGTDKAKYGIIGEGFRNYNIADYKNPDFTVTMEKDSMTPSQKSRTEGLTLLSNSNTVDNEKTITLNYTETPAIVQDVTSNKTISVQPFLFAQFIGHVGLTPEIDFWVSEVLKPEVIRGPEVTQIQTVTVKEVIRDRVVEPSPQPTVPSPPVDATKVIIKDPGNVTPPIIPPDPPIEFPPVIPDHCWGPPTLPPDPPLPVTPVEYYPQPPTIWDWTYAAGYPVAFSGQAIDFLYDNYASTSYPSSFIWSVPSYTQVWPNVDLLSPVYAAGVNYASTPLPETSAPVYDSSLTATSTGSTSVDDYSMYDWSYNWWNGY